MGWVFVVAGVAAGVLLYGQGQFLLLAVAVISAIGTFWTYGVMHNYTIQSAATRQTFRGSFGGITERDADSVPNAPALLNLVFSLASVGSLLAAIVIAI